MQQSFCHVYHNYQQICQLPFYNVSKFMRASMKLMLISIHHLRAYISITRKYFNYPPTNIKEKVYGCEHGVVAYLNHQLRAFLKLYLNKRMHSCSFSQQIYGGDHKSFTIYITITSKYVNYPFTMSANLWGQV